MKPNLLRPSRPDEAITTHPSVVEAASRIVRDLGGTPLIAESPGGPFTRRTLNRVYDRCGIREAAGRCGATLNEDTTTVALSHPEGRLIKHLEVIRPLLEVDGVLNLPKAKTHSFMVLTGAVKNLFGFIPGLKKPGYHATMKEPHRFAEMLLDLVTLVKPALTIMDGIVGMEGDGPSAGNPRRLGFLISGRSPVHVDWAFSRLVGLEPRRVSVLEAALHRGWVQEEDSFIEMGDTSLAQGCVKGFRLPKTIYQRGGLGALPFMDLLLGLLATSCALKPHIPPSKCEGCGVCHQNCPVGAIQIASGHAEIDHELCIRCYCCHELCPQKIVELRGSFLYRCLRPLSGKGQG